ncbi:MAG: hypothetical protein OXC69_08570 [Candidatus Tectomicrobia bacterium]|nr:hypothetical protein [Candidatus Tectomicrobia bacterium]
MKFDICIVVVILVQGWLYSLVAATSSEVADAFSRLDALAEELAERQRALGEGTDTTAVQASPPSAVATPAPTLVAPNVGVQEDITCGSRQEINAQIRALEGRYGDRSIKIIAVNKRLPMFRQGVLDTQRACTAGLTDDISAALARVEGLDLEADYRVVDTLTVCVNRLRQAADGELGAATSNIRMQRLAEEMNRLTSMTHQVADLERALLRGISKRNRLKQELEQYRQEIEAVCL